MVQHHVAHKLPDISPGQAVSETNVSMSFLLTSIVSAMFISSLNKQEIMNSSVFSKDVTIHQQQIQI